MPRPDGRPHVMHVYSRLNVGGIEKLMVSLLPRLNEGRYRVSLCLLKGAGQLADVIRERGVELFVLPLEGRLRPSSLRTLGGLFRRTGTRIVQAHVREANTTATVAARLARVPVVIGTIHSLNRIQGRRRLLQDRLLAAWRDTTIAVSESVKRNYSETVGVPPARVTVLYNGVDLSEFGGERLIPAERAAVLEPLGIDPRDVVVVCVARLVPPKAHEVLLDAAARVLARAPGCTFLLVGDGLRAAELAETARRTGIASKVVFAGRRDDVPRLLRASDVALLTSSREGFSVFVIESLAAGLPIVATDVGGNAEAIEEGASGFLRPAGDAPGIAEALVPLVLDGALRATMSLAARKQAERFSLETAARETEALYDRLLRARGIDPP